MRPSFLRRAALPVLALSACFLAVAGRAGSPSSGIDPANIDPNMSACTDFFQYANGGWLARNEIPPAFSVWGSASGVREKNIAVLKQVLEEAAADKAAKVGSNEQKVGDFYTACMDETRAEAEGAKPLTPGLERIAKLRDAKALPALVAYLHEQGVGALFSFGASPDLKESRQTIAFIGQGGLGMPDRDYYLKEDEKSKQLREAYARMLMNMFRLIGETPEHAQGSAQTVLRLETELARNSLDRVARRDPNRQYNKMTVAELQKLAPAFDFAAYFKAIGAPAFADLNVGQPDFIRGLDKVLTGASPEDLRTYLRWNLVRNAAGSLSTPFFNENFEFYGKALTGAKEPQARWRRCVNAADATLGEALGEAYVKRAFPPESKARMQQLVTNLIAALRDDIPMLQWMSEPTRKAALDKLAAFKHKIGYPDKWRDYSALKIDRASHVENLRRAATFERRRNLTRIGQPVDKTEWLMSPPTVNAYHNALFTEIVFPAGILQPPLFNPQADDAVNYGGIGSVIGHEITHGFDDQGRKYDLNGNLRDWWTESDARAYDERARCVEEQFSAFEIEPGLKLTGKLVLGESIADLGGLKIAWLAFQKSLEGKPRPEKIDGFTPEQRFFLGYAQAWSRKYRAEELRRLAAVDPHPPGMFRVNGPLSNMPQFAEAFQCKMGDAMVRPADKRCQVW